MLIELSLEMDVPFNVISSSIKTPIHLDDRDTNKHIIKFKLTLWLEGNIRDATAESEERITKVNFKWGKKLRCSTSQIIPVVWQSYVTSNL